MVMVNFIQLNEMAMHESILKKADRYRLGTGCTCICQITLVL